MNNPTAGATDGTYVSTDGVYTAPISFVLNSKKSYEERYQEMKLAVRTEKGYKTVGETLIYLQLSTDDLSTVRNFENYYLYWADVYTDESGYMPLEGDVSNYNGKITTTNSIGSSNKIFYLYMLAEENEENKVDHSIRLVVACTIEAESEAS